MTKRLLLWSAVAGGVLALSGCVVVPDAPYGPGYAYPGAAVRVVPPPVVVVPAPRYRYYGDGYYGGRYYGDRRHGDRRHGDRRYGDRHHR
jgi:hypothetical protein